VGCAVDNAGLVLARRYEEAVLFKDSVVALSDAGEVVDGEVVRALGYALLWVRYELRLVERDEAEGVNCELLGGAVQ